MEREWDELCEEYGTNIVEFVNRCFYMRSWRKIHGTYPYELDYLMLRAILACEEEISLRTAKTSYDSMEKSRQAGARGGPPSGVPGPGGVRKGVPITNKF